MEQDLPTHPVLAAVARNMERIRWWATISDSEFKLVWISPEFVQFFGEDVKSLYGKPYMEFTMSDFVISKSTRGSVLRAGLDFLPAFIDKTPGGREAIRAQVSSILGEGAGSIVDQLPDHQDPVFLTSVKWAPVEGMAPVNLTGMGVEIYDRNATFVGFLNLFLASLPSRLVTLLARGDEASLERMARLTKPGRRSAAILFADLQSSALLSRRLASAVYFRLVRALTTAIDSIIVSHGGIVGRHAGDGVTAFFLTDDLGSPSATARAAIAAAREIRHAVEGVAGEFEEETSGLISAKGCPMNVGLHWGGSLYMGQLVTGGRLEVTALGDAVNECARIQESARDGQILVAKTLLENLDASDAMALSLDPDAVSYTSIADIPNVSEKAVRDAGGIAVATL